MHELSIAMSIVEVAAEEAQALHVEEVAVVAWCPHCQRRQAIESIQQLKCPECGTPTPEIVAGRQLEVTGLEVVDDPAFSDAPDAADADCGSAPAGAQAQ